MDPAVDERPDALLLEDGPGGARLVEDALADPDRLHELLRRAPAAIALLRGPRHVFELANPAYLRMVGRQSPAQLLGRPLREALPELGDGTIFGLLGRLFSGGEATTLRAVPAFLNPRAGGAPDRLYDVTIEPYRDAGGAVEGLMLYAVDVTEAVGTARRRDDRERRAAEALAVLAAAGAVLASTLEYEDTLRRVAGLAVPVFGDMCVVDLVDDGGRADRVAVAVADPQKQALADRLRAYPPDLRNTVGVAGVLCTGEPLLMAEVSPALLEAVARDAEHLALLRAFPFTSSIVVPLAAQERIIGALTLTTLGEGRRYGLEDLPLAEELARRATLAIENARLYAAAQRALHARTEYLAVAAHELRTPLTALRGNAQLLTRRIERGGELDRGALLSSAHGIVAGADRAAHMIARLLDLARVEAGQLEVEPVDADLAELVTRLVGTLERAYADHRLVLSVAGPCPAWVDPLRVDQVLTNLIDNAAKFSPPGAPIEIAVAADGPDLARVAVRDHGPGVPAELRERLFERFYRAEAGGTSGLGLGLYVSRQIAELHGGTLRVEEPPGGGARFVLTLPRRAS